MQSIHCANGSNHYNDVLQFVCFYASLDEWILFIVHDDSLRSLGDSQSRNRRRHCSRWLKRLMIPSSVMVLGLLLLPATLSKAWAQFRWMVSFEERRSGRAELTMQQQIFIDGCAKRKPGERKVRPRTTPIGHFLGMLYLIRPRSRSPCRSAGPCLSGF